MILESFSKKKVLATNSFEASSFLGIGLGSRR